MPRATTKLMPPREERRSTLVAAVRRASATMLFSCTAISRRSGGNEATRKFETRTPRADTRPVPPHAGHSSLSASRNACSTNWVWFGRLRSASARSSATRKVTRVFMCTALCCTFWVAQRLRNLFNNFICLSSVRHGLRQKILASAPDRRSKRALDESLLLGVCAGHDRLVWRGGGKRPAGGASFAVVGGTG